MRALMSILLCSAASIAHTAPMATPPSVTPPSDAEIREMWGGGSWKTDRFAGGGWMSGFKTEKEYTDPEFVPPNMVPLMEPELTRYKAIRRSFGEHRPIFGPYALCHPAGMPYLITLNGYGGYQVVVGDHEMVMLFGQNLDYRRIYLDGRPHPDPAITDPWYNGHSVGHWEGHTLVIDTDNIKGENTQVEPHLPKPEGSHLVERYTPEKPGVMDASFTMTNPRFTRPWVVHYKIIRYPEGKLVEGLCTDGNRYSLDAEGQLKLHNSSGKPLEKAED